MKDEQRDRIYEVRIDRGDFSHSAGAYRSRDEAERSLQAWQESERQQDAASGSTQPATREWIEEIDTTDMWAEPPRDKLRERFTTRVTDASDGGWPRRRVEVLDGGEVIAEYERNYAMLDTFEPFRQGDGLFALISPDYTATSVMDLSTGEIIAAEEPSSLGFCPAGFYVPDWWDIHDGRKLPGSMQWKPEDDAWPNGDFGFVWGCVWGDDDSWKIQHLDLSRIRDGIISRDERFGYLALATDSRLEPSDVIMCWSSGGRRYVRLRIEREFNLATGVDIDAEDDE